MKRPKRKHEQPQARAEIVGTVAPAPAVGEVDIRARPGRRTVEERQHAVLELMAGKATVDQIARRLGVHAATVEGWRADALAGVEQALRRGTGKTAAELELERKHRDLEKVSRSACWRTRWRPSVPGALPGPRGRGDDSPHQRG